MTTTRAKRQKMYEPRVFKVYYLLWFSLLVEMRAPPIHVTVVVATAAAVLVLSCIFFVVLVVVPSWASCYVMFSLTFSIQFPSFPRFRQGV